MCLNRCWRYLLPLLVALLLLEFTLQKLNFPRYNEFYGQVSMTAVEEKDCLEQKIRDFVREIAKKETAIDPDLIPVELKEEVAYDEVVFSLYLRGKRIWCFEKRRVNAKNIDIVAEDAAFLLVWHYLSKRSPSKERGSPFNEKMKIRTIV